MLKAIQVCTALIMVIGLGTGASADNGGDKTMRGKPNDRISAKAASGTKKKTARSTKPKANDCGTPGILEGFRGIAEKPTEKTEPKKGKGKKKFDMVKFTLEQIKKRKREDKKYGLQWYLEDKNRLIRLYKRWYEEEETKIDDLIYKYESNGDVYAKRIINLFYFMYHDNLAKQHKKRYSYLSTNSKYYKCYIEVHNSKLINRNQYYEKIPELDRKRLIEPERNRLIPLTGDRSTPKTASKKPKPASNKPKPTSKEPKPASKRPKP